MIGKSLIALLIIAVLIVSGCVQTEIKPTQAPSESELESVDLVLEENIEQDLDLEEELNFDLGLEDLE